MTQNLDDFQKQDIKFDIAKLQQAYKEIVKTQKFEDAGVTNFGAISLTQIPGDPESIEEVMLEVFIGPNQVNQAKKFREM